MEGTKDCFRCLNWVQESDTGQEYCEVDEQPETCGRYYDLKDARDDAKNQDNDRY